MNKLVVTDPLRLRDARAFLYFARVLDANGFEYRYVGRTHRPSRPNEYVRNISRIFAGLPRRTTPGQERYRAVHLALARACEYGWPYEFYRLESAEPSCLAALETQRKTELDCNLNGAGSW